MLGKPSTKKTSQTITWGGGGRKRRPHIQPSPAYQKALVEQVPQLEQQGLEVKDLPLGHKTSPLWVKAVYLFKDYMYEPDLDNLNTSLADLLQKAGIVKNDRYIQCWDGSKKVMNTGEEATIIEIKPGHITSTMMTNEKEILEQWKRIWQ